MGTGTLGQFICVEQGFQFISWNLEQTGRLEDQVDQFWFGQAVENETSLTSRIDQVGVSHLHKHSRPPTTCQPWRMLHHPTTTEIERAGASIRALKLRCGGGVHTAPQLRPMPLSQLPPTSPDAQAPQHFNKLHQHHYPPRREAVRPTVSGCGHRSAVCCPSRGEVRPFRLLLNTTGGQQENATINLLRWAERNNSDSSYSHLPILMDIGVWCFANSNVVLLGD